MDYLYIIFRWVLTVHLLLLIRVRFVIRTTLSYIFSGNTQANFIEELTSTSKNLEDLLNIDKPNFEQKYVRHPSESQLQIANCFNTKAPFWNSDFFMTNEIGRLNFMISKLTLIFKYLLFLLNMETGPRSSSCKVYILKLIQFARVTSNVI